MSIVKDALFYKKARRKDVSSNQSHALIMENQGREQESTQGKGRGRSISRGRSKGRFVDGRKLTYKFFHCGLEGHLKKNWRKLQKEERQNNN